MESFRTADSRTLSYRREGEGPVLVCHPGGPGFSARYFGDLAGLGSAFTLVMLNPRGSEGSDHPADTRAYQTADYVSDLDELRAHLGLERMLLLGHSHGGVVAAAYAAAHPDRVERLVLASTLARFAAEQEAVMEAAMDEKAAEPWYADAVRPSRTSRRAASRPTRSSASWPSASSRSTSPGTATPSGHTSRRSAARFPSPMRCLLFNDEVFTTFDLRSDLRRSPRRRS